MFRISSVAERSARLYRSHRACRPRSCLRPSARPGPLLCKPGPEKTGSRQSSPLLAASRGSQTCSSRRRGAPGPQLPPELREKATRSCGPRSLRGVRFSHCGEDRIIGVPSVPRDGVRLFGGLMCSVPQAATVATGPASAMAANRRCGMQSSIPSFHNLFFSKNTVFALSQGSVCKGKRDSCRGRGCDKVPRASLCRHRWRPRGRPAPFVSSVVRLAGPRPPRV